MKNLNNLGRNIRIILGGVAILGLSACASMSGLQTARTLPKGKAQSTFGGGNYASGDLLKAVDKDALGGEDVSVPFAEYTYRQGFGEKWDAGLKVTLIGTAVLDAKYALIDNEKFALSAGGGLGYLNIESGSGDNKTETTIFDVIIPLYASYDFTDKFSIYAVPKYIFRSISGNSSGSSSLVGATVGVKIGKEWGTMLEAGQFKDPNSDFTLSQANVAIFWEPSKKLINF